MTETVRAATADGRHLVMTRFPATGSRRGVCLLTHAMMASARVFGTAERPGLAHHLARCGVECFSLDFRGHGSSVPPDPRTSDWCFDDYVELDLPAAVSAVSRIADVSPRDISYLGHSLGGLVGLAGFGTGVVPTPRRLILIAVSLWLAGPRGTPGRRGRLALAWALSRGLGFVPAKRLRLGSDDEPRGYMEQMFGWYRSGRWTSRVGVDYLEAAGRVKAAVLAATGDGDQLCRSGDADHVLSHLREADTTLRPVGIARGDAVDPDHFSLVSTPELAGFWTDLAGWVART